MNCVVTRKELKAILHFASADPNRYALNSCRIEVLKKNECPILIATDGRIIGVIKSAHVIDSTCQTGAVNLRKELIVSILGCFYNAASLRIISDEKTIRINPDGSTGMELVTDNYFSVTGLGFPKWRLVLPGKQTPKERIAQSRVTLDAGLLSRAYKAFNDLGVKRGSCNRALEIGIIDSVSMLVPKFTALTSLWIGLMPVRNESESELYLPTFLEAETEVPATTTAP